MKLAFVFMCICFVYLGHASARIVGGFGEEESATSEIQGFANRVSNMTLYQFVLNACQKGSRFFEKRVSLFYFWVESGTGTKAWPEKSFKFQINSIYKKISLYMYTNTIAVWSLTCTIVKCVSHQIVYY